MSRDIERQADVIDLKLFHIASSAELIANEFGRKPSAHDWREIAVAAKRIRPLVRKYMSAKQREETGG